MAIKAVNEVTAAASYDNGAKLRAAGSTVKKCLTDAGLTITSGKIMSLGSTPTVVFELEDASKINAFYVSIGKAGWIKSKKGGPTSFGLPLEEDTRWVARCVYQEKMASTPPKLYVTVRKVYDKKDPIEVVRRSMSDTRG